MLRPAAFLVGCLLLDLVSSAALSSDSGSWPSSSSESDEDPQLPAEVPDARPGVIVEVKDTRTNITLSFAVFIIADKEEEEDEEDEGSGSDRRGRSGDSGCSSESDDISDEVSSEEVRGQNIRPMTGEYTSEEMMGDQPALTEDHEQTLSDVNGLMSDVYDDSEVNGEVNDQRDVTAFHYFSDVISRSADFSDPSSPEVAVLHNQSSSEVLLDLEEVTSSSSEKTGSGGKAEVLASRGSVSEDSGFGSRLQGVFRSFQEVVDLLSGHQGVKGLTGSESVSSDPVNQTGGGSDPDSDESLESAPSTQRGTGSRESAQQVSGPTTSPDSDLISPGPTSDEVQDPSHKSARSDPGQDLAPTMPTFTVSGEGTRSFSQVGGGLNADSSEESQESVSTPEVVGSRTMSSPGPISSSSSSEEIQSSSSSIPSPQTPAESGSSESDSGPELDSQSTGELQPGPALTPDSDPSPESTSDPDLSLNLSSSSELTHEESEESPTIRVLTGANSDASTVANPTVDYGANTASIAASPDVSMDTKPDSSVEADFSSEATTDASNDVSIEADPTTATVFNATPPSMHISAAARIETGSDLSVGEENDANTEATKNSVAGVEPTTTSTSGASTDAIASVEKQQARADVSTEANSPGPKQTGSSEENMAAPPPRRKKPYRFGFLGPISHSYSNQPVSKETRIASPHTNVRETPARRHRHNNPRYTFLNSRQQVGLRGDRKQMRVTVAAVANPGQSSSEETT